MSHPPHRSTLADHEVIRQVVPRFVSRLPGTVQKMRAAFHEGRPEDLRYLAHQLRGAGDSFGFEPISAHAMAIEEALSAGQPIASVETDLLALIAYIERVEGYPREA